MVTLAAGYSTRQYPLKLPQSKPMLLLASKPMIEYVIDDLATTGGIDEMFVLKSYKFVADVSPMV